MYRYYQVIFAFYDLLEVNYIVSQEGQNQNSKHFFYSRLVVFGSETFCLRIKKVALTAEAFTGGVLIGAFKSFAKFTKEKCLKREKRSVCSENI